MRRNGNWGAGIVVRDALTGRTAFTDSPTGNYPANARNYVQLRTTCEFAECSSSNTGVSKPGGLLNQTPI